MIFVDTGAFIARYLIRDQYHKRALRLWQKIQAGSELCVTSNFVLDETITPLARRSTYQFAARKARLIDASSLFQILRPTLDDERAALDLLEKYADQKVSYTDCVSFVLMRQSRIKTAFSFDRHFVHAGFELWS